MAKVRNMESKNGRAVPNQLIIEDDKGNTFFQSYETTIIKVTANGKTYLDPKWNYSNTTSRYRSEFLGETTAETEKKIASGEYKIVNLNKE